MVDLIALQKHMELTHCFSRIVVANAIAKSRAENRCISHEIEAAKVLKTARQDGVVQFLHNRERSCYYEFLVKQCPVCNGRKGEQLWRENYWRPCSRCDGTGRIKND